MTRGERLGKEIRGIGTTEARQFVFDFTGSMESTHTISAVSGSDAYSVARGVTESTGEITIGTPSINSSGSVVADGETIRTSGAVLVLLRAPSGIVGKLYEVVCTVTTSNGDTLTIVGRLRVE